MWSNLFSIIWTFSTNHFLQFYLLTSLLTIMAWHFFTFISLSSLHTLFYQPDNFLQNYNFIKIIFTCNHWTKRNRCKNAPHWHFTYILTLINLYNKLVSHLTLATNKILTTSYACLVTCHALSQIIGVHCISLSEAQGAPIFILTFGASRHKTTRQALVNCIRLKWSQRLMIKSRSTCEASLRVAIFTWGRTGLTYLTTVCL